MKVKKRRNPEPRTSPEDVAKAIIRAGPEGVTARTLARKLASGNVCAVYRAATGLQDVRREYVLLGDGRGPIARQVKFYTGLT